jgi:hypothetical protein
MNEDKLDNLLKEKKDTPVQRTDYMAFTRNITVVLAFVLMIAVAVFQWIEIQEYDIQDNMFERLGNMFSSEETVADSESAEEDSDAGEKTEDQSTENKSEEAAEE